MLETFALCELSDKGMSLRGTETKDGRGRSTGNTRTREHIHTCNGILVFPSFHAKMQITAIVSFHTVEA